MNFELLKHHELNVDFEFVSNLIWYSAAKDSYLQRDSSLDNTWINEETSNPFVSFLCRKFLELNSLTIYDKVSICDSYARNVENLPDNSIGIYLSTKSLFFDLCHKIRNSVAHGTFNIIQNEFFGIGQVKAKSESEINLYYKFKLFDNEMISKFFESVYVLSTMNCNDLKMFALKYLSAIDVADNKFLIGEKAYLFENCDFTPSKISIKKIMNEGSENLTHIFNKINYIPALNGQIEELKKNGVIISIEEFLNMF